MKALVWTSVPNHYQAALFAALRSAGVDLQVCYYERVSKERLALGWDDTRELPPGEHYVEDSLQALESVPDWRERIHMVPGYRLRFLRKLVRTLARAGTPWVHWSEPSHLGLKWYLSWPLKRWYARMLNHHALGAFGIGKKALEDFARWGIDPQRMAYLFYASPPCDLEAEPDDECTRFCDGRPAFVFLGRLCRRKGTDVLLRAFARATKPSKEWRLLLVGPDDSGGSYGQLAEHMGTSEQVLFRGAVSPDALGSVLRTAKVLVLPSRFDGWGVVLNEAASAGLALIASDMAGASHHLIHPGENGFRVKAGDVSSLVAAMGAYVSSPDLAATHGERSLKVFEDFTPERNAQRFISAIRSWQAMDSGICRRS